ncbi:hypothetical protein SUGI_0471410 [Cryptomeria japonica]|uniref:nuclear transport factor 2B n=1 Tax=Cryptomeria japonica TaxID=3369 RepID=UPI0024089513|nr:nuclear transport factor 2B [Cryptomeria japonica]GLJ24657.1 hypothetical protein SUGI_0471410 [Cryptomeria japonica]
MELEAPVEEMTVQACTNTNFVETVPEVDEVGKAFVDQYYYMFDHSRGSLLPLYESYSTMSFEGEKIEGAHKISVKLASLPFDQCKHHVSTIDCQSSGVAGGIIVFVSGTLQLPGEEHHLRFSQMFHLVRTLEGNFYIQNDIFRLNYG